MGVPSAGERMAIATKRQDKHLRRIDRKGSVNKMKRWRLRERGVLVYICFMERFFSIFSDVITIVTGVVSLAILGAAWVNKKRPFVRQ